jgi:hypothetical protein
MLKRDIILLTVLFFAVSIIAESEPLENGSLGGIILTPDGKKPAAGVVVKVLDPEDGKLIAGAKTDEYGIYRISELPPGSYVIGVETEEGAFIGRSLITIESGKASMTPFRLMEGKAGAAISGTVYREDGRTPFPSVGIKLIDLETKTVAVKAVSGAKGEFLIAGIPEGSYILVFETSAGEYILWKARLELSDKVKLRLSLRLREFPATARGLSDEMGLDTVVTTPRGLAEIISETEAAALTFFHRPKGAALIISSALIPPIIWAKWIRKASPATP